MKQITLEVPEHINEKLAKLIFELGLAIIERFSQESGDTRIS